MSLIRKGNAIPVGKGEQLGVSPSGKYIQVKDSEGNPTGLRLDGGHRSRAHTDPRSLEPHAHRPDVSNPDGTPWLPVNQ